METNASFSGHNSGSQVAQNFGTINYNSSEASACHQSFRIANASSAGYEWYKDRIEERVAGTCQWVLNHQDYRLWKERASGPLLISADPGCGKSVLAKYLIDHDLSGTICYFFFKEQDQNTFKQALCALIHQLLTKKPSLSKYAIPKYKANGAKLVDLVDPLWDILQEAAHDTQAGSITIVLDALDECRPSDLVVLTRKLTHYYQLQMQGNTKLKFLLTSRPYTDVVSEFWQLVELFPNIQIPGEEYSNEICQEVDCVVEHRIRQLAKKFQLKPELTETLRRRLKSTHHRTYLWTYLLFDYLEQGFKSKGLKKTHKEIQASIHSLPESVNHAYEKLLQRTTDSQKARKSLSILLAAARPFTLQEMNVAVNVEPFSEKKSVEELDLEDITDFQHTLRGWCGLLISIHNEKIYFLHHTAREFLLASQSQASTESWQWLASMKIEESHLLLADICTAYLNFDEYDRETSHSEGDPNPRDHPFHKSPFFDYSALYWGEHTRRAGKDMTLERTRLAASTCSLKYGDAPYWFRHLSAEHGHNWHRRYFSPLGIASFLGFNNLVEYLIPTETVNYHDKPGMTPLYLASLNGHTDVVQLLLEQNIEVDIQNQYGQVALHRASMNGHTEIVQLLLERNADVDIQAEDGCTALHLASWHRNTEIVRLLLKRNIEVDIQDIHGWTALHFASNNGKTEIVRLLLERNADVDIQTEDGWTALHFASLNGNTEIVRLLLERDADVDIRNKFGCTALHSTSRDGNTEIARLLLERNIEVDIQDRHGWTALHFASLNGNTEIVRLLLERHADIDLKDNREAKAEQRAREGQHEVIVHLLYEHRSNQ